MRPCSRWEPVFVVVLLLQVLAGVRPRPAPVGTARARDPIRSEPGIEVLRAWDAGPARAAIPDPGFRGPCRLLRGSELVGRGEVLDWLPHAGLAELRGLVPAGRFRLEAGTRRGTAGGGVEEQDPGLAACLLLEGAALRFRHGEGLTFPRFVAGGHGERLELDAELLRYGSAAFECRVAIRAGKDFDSAQPLWVELGLPAQLARDCAPIRPREARVERTATGLRLALPAGHLRPGDLVFVAVRGGIPPGDPLLRLCWPASGLAALGFAAARRPARAADGFVREVEEILRDLAAERRHAAPLDRGDCLRRPARGRQPALWAHLEFDLPLGLLLLGQERGDRDLVLAARLGVEHLLGRDCSRPWRAATAGLRLPVVHGVEHGRGRVETGHCFLESAVLLATLSADRLLTPEVSEAVRQLASLVPRAIHEARRLRDLAWPLAVLALAVRCFDDGLARRLGRALVARLAALADGPGFRLTETSGPGGELRLELWLVAGLLLPALERAERADLAGAAALRRELRTALAGLAVVRTRATAYLQRRPGGPWLAAGGDVDPCFEVFLVEGLREAGLGSASLRSRERRLCDRWPGRAFDPGTQLAMALRWPRLRALLR